MKDFHDAQGEILLRKILKVLLLAGGLAVLLELSFHLVVAPQLRLQKIYVSGDDRGMSTPQLLALLGIPARSYYFSVSDKALKARLETIPWVLKATVTKDFPDALKVNIVARDPLALALDESSGRTVLLSVDSHGVIFDVSPQDQRRNLPIISGIRFQTLQPGAVFPSALHSLFTSLAALRKDSPGLYSQISEIRVRKTEGGSFETLIYPVEGDVRIVLPERWTQALLKQAFVLLDVIHKQGWTAKTKEIDLRTSPVVVRSRES
ncbi:MAG: FtsQ-type POTRA domain-containing protein [Spirochaetales bacterium]|nr:FtsQ-type POTRA domain-containing protein [Spirochaetales bacterium]